MFSNSCRYFINVAYLKGLWFFETQHKFVICIYNGHFNIFLFNTLSVLWVFYSFKKRAYFSTFLANLWLVLCHFLEIFLITIFFWKIQLCDRSPKVQLEIFLMKKCWKYFWWKNVGKVKSELYTIFEESPQKIYNIIVIVFMITTPF